MVMLGGDQGITYQADGAGAAEWEMAVAALRSGMGGRVTAVSARYGRIAVT
jgi:hypothetical protein